MSIIHNTAARMMAWVRANALLIVAAVSTLGFVVLVFVTSFRIYDTRRIQSTVLCRAAMDNRMDNNAQNDAMRNILTMASGGGDPARLELLLSQIPANRPLPDCGPTTTQP